MKRCKPLEAAATRLPNLSGPEVRSPMLWSARCATHASTASSKARQRSCACSSRVKRWTPHLRVAGDVMDSRLPLVKRLSDAACRLVLHTVVPETMAPGFSQNAENGPCLEKACALRGPHEQEARTKNVPCDGETRTQARARATTSLRDSSTSPQSFSPKRPRQAAPKRSSTKVPMPVK